MLLWAVLRHAFVLTAAVLAVASGILACDDFDEDMNDVALELVPPESEVVLNENCGESPMAGDCSILYLDPSWAEADARLVAYRQLSQSAGWDVFDSNERLGLVLTRDGYFGTITLGASPAARGCPIRDDPARCADVIHVRDR